MNTYALASVLVLGIATSACGDEPASESTAQDVIEKWRSAGLDVGKHEIMTNHSFGQAQCARGAVSGIETTLCLYQTRKAAEAAQTAGLEHVGNVTGAVLQHEKLLLVVADRNKRDKEGRTINLLTKTYLRR